MDQTIPGNTPTVSIIMCAYNGLHYTQQALTDILAQTFQDWELIIADDGSTDGTREWLQQYATDPRIHVITNKTNLGYVANKNNALRQARGQYLTQLDNDDRSAPDRLQKMMEVIYAQPSIKVVGSGYKRINDDNEVLGIVAPDSDIVLKSRPAQGYPFWFPGLLAHRSVFETIGYFDPYFGGIGDDIYWTVKVNKLYPIYCLKEPLYFYRNNPDSLTNSSVTVRKLVLPEILKRVLAQYEQTGTDLLMQGKMEELKAQEEALAGNRVFMAGQYRIWAAKAVDKGDLKMAWKLIGQSMSRNPFNPSLFRTILYAIRKNK